MSLDLALANARSGLSLVQRQLAQSAADIANADTAGYTDKRVEGRSVQAEGRPLGVRTLEARRDIDTALVTRLNATRAEQAAAAVREDLLGRVELAHGRAEGGDSLGDLTGALRDALIALRDAPSEGLRQSDAVRAADDLVLRFHATSDAVGEARQAAQDGMAAEVDAINAALREVARLTELIRPERAAGRSTADLEDKRDAELARLAESLELRAVERPDGGLTLLGRNGLSLPLHSDRDVLSLGSAAVGAAAYYGPPAGTLPGVMLNGTDITGQALGGRLGEYAALRDTTLPRLQAELDVAAAGTAFRLEQQGLRLFTAPDGTVPDPATPYASGGWIGFAGVIQVNAAVAADPSLLRDGTHAVAGSAGGPTAFTPNPAGGPASFVTLLDRALEFAFGREVSGGNAHPALPTSGLGPNGALSSTLAAPGGIADYAATLVAVQTGARAAAAAAGESAATLLAGLEERFARRSGVDVDAEVSAMVTLQNAYAANARIMSAVQQMYDALFGAVR